MKIVIHLLVKNPDYQDFTTFPHGVEKHMPADVVCPETGKDFIVGFANPFRSIGYFVHARFQKRIILVSLLFRPCVNGVRPNLIEIFCGLFGDVILRHAYAPSSAAGNPANRNLPQYHCSNHLRWQSAVRPFSAPALPEDEDRSELPRWRYCIARSGCWPG